MSLSSLTPEHGTPVLDGKRSRRTPVRGAAAIPAQGLRLTPIHGSVAIPGVSAGIVAETSRTLRERVRLRTGTLELLVFRLANELFGIDLTTVEEAIDLPTVRHVPEMPPAMLGVITVRGSLTSLYSPERALGLALAASASALIFKRERGRVALVVDDVDDVFTLDLTQLRDAPGVEGDGILLGVVRRADALLGLVDAEALIAACQAIPVLETA
jgi:purine-binding chemotaxis protein CheW